MHPINISDAPLPLFTFSNHITILHISDASSPSSSPSSFTFQHLLEEDHENNRQSKLLTLNGDLSINNTVVPIIVWISELYPFHAPYVYVGMSSVANNVDPNGRLHLKYTTGWSAQHDLVTLMKHVEKSLNTQISAAHPPVYPPLSQGSPVQHVLLPQQDCNYLTLSPL